ncbi:hypothetical protein [Actinomadura madurae]|uniref:hypothetical protein n=1 Tax=Actinomadura madurae TaxID=1993 RepID=UPI0020D1FA84|nr:hypothetical protein [Actinomadura madurae]MCP9977359.1 hypothetical protein [Actinomadura madurae]
MTDQGGTGLRHAPAGESESRLARNRLGVAGIVFFVVAAAAPLVGMTGAVPIAIVLGNGAGVPGAYLAAGIVLLVFSVGYSAMSHRVTNTGAFFAYVGRGLGVVPGVGSAFVSLLAYVAVQLAVFGFFGAVMARPDGRRVRHHAGLVGVGAHRLGPGARPVRAQRGHRSQGPGPADDP